MATPVRPPRSSALPAIGAVVLFSLFPLLNLLSNNTGQVRLLSAGRSAVVVVAGSLLALGIARLVLRDWPRATLLVIGALLLFFSYGHAYDLIRHAEISGVLMGRHRYLIPVWGALGLLWMWVVLRVGSRTSAASMLVLGAILAAVPTASLFVGGARSLLAEQARPSIDTAATAANPVGELPDIYYVILDGHGRADVLEELYGIDSQGFLTALEQLGFYIAQDSRTNYTHTLQSLASSLNMMYLDDLAAEMGSGSTDRAPLEELVQHSAVRQTLEGLGYQTMAFETGYPPTELLDADVYYPAPYEEFEKRDLAALREDTLPFNEFEELLARTTALRPLLDDLIRRQDPIVRPLGHLYRNHRTRVVYTLQAAVEAARMDGPQFVFAHIVSPHPPFVLAQPGEELVAIGTYSLRDSTCCTTAEYLRGYRGQLSVVDALALEMVEAILAESDNEPVIILQGDHGPGAYFDQEVLLRSNIRERVSILNAYYLPGGTEGLLYPSITPVNTFRVILNRLFGAAYQPLRDESYLVAYDAPYAFTPVTEEMLAR